MKVCWVAYGEVNVVCLSFYAHCTSFNKQFNFIFSLFLNKMYSDCGCSVDFNSSDCGSNFESSGEEG